MKSQLTAVMFTFLCLVWIVGCTAQRAPLFDASYATTKSKSIDPSKGKKLSQVTSEAICNGKDGLGQMETAVNDALSKAPGATYLKDPSFTLVNGKCVEVEGIAYK